LKTLPSLPRPKSERGIVGTVTQAMPNATHKLDQRHNQTGQIFISYRNIFNEETGSETANEVDKLKQRIEKGKFHNGQDKVVRYFPPGVLSAEVMTEQRRWHILSMIDRFIGPADEF
jgi:hypothetical protein